MAAFLLILQSLSYSKPIPDLFKDESFQILVFFMLVGHLKFSYGLATFIFLKRRLVATTQTLYWKPRLALLKFNPQINDMFNVGELLSLASILSPRRFNCWLWFEKSLRFYTNEVSRFIRLFQLFYVLFFFFSQLINKLMPAVCFFMNSA